MAQQPVPKQANVRLELPFQPAVATPLPPGIDVISRSVLPSGLQRLLLPSCGHGLSKALRQQRHYCVIATQAYTILQTRAVLW